MGKITDGFSPEKLNAIFHHPDCRKVFNERCEAIRLPDSESLNVLSAAIHTCKGVFSFNDFNFTNEEFAGFLTKPLHELHTGITIRVCNMLRGVAIEKYASVYPAKVVMSATFEVEKQLQDIIKPIKDEVIADFYEKATIIQTNEINRVVNETEKRMKQAGNNLIQMPR
jgi:hypothetical protein